MDGEQSGGITFKHLESIDTQEMETQYFGVAALLCDKIMLLLFYHLTAL